jgi:peptidoglycan/LPS O-acetylase OafA/YrhL
MSPPRLAYHPALDGIRGLAVFAVLAYHAGLPWARGGFLGVDAFFVLSGYLITSLLLAEQRAGGSIGLLGFWTRRARRLLPALFLVLAAVAGYAAVFAEAEELSRLRADALATLGYIANWRYVFAGESYFEQFAVPSPLRHTWSLAIEEQWYIIWPVVVLLLLRARGGSAQTLLYLSIALAVGSALLMALLYDPHADPSRVYYGTDTRAQSLLVGAALAAWLVGCRDVPALAASAPLQLGAFACATFVVWMWTAISSDSDLLYRGGLLLLAAAVAVVIAAAMRPGPVGRALSFAPLRGLGLVSYGVYLWHWPLYLVLTPERTGWDGHALFALRFAVTLAIAIASYQLVEQPFRRGALRGWRISWSLAPAAAAALAVALVLVTRGGGTDVAVATSAPPVSDVAGAASPPVRVLVVGDSVAFTMGQGLARVEREWNLSVWNNSRLGCGVLRADAVRVKEDWIEQEGSCDDWPVRWRSYVETFQPDVVVLLAGAWDLYDRRYAGEELAFGTPEADAFVLRELDTAVDVLSSRGAAVFLLTTPHYEPRDLGLVVDGPRFERARIDRLNALYKTLAARRSGDAVVLDLQRLVAKSSAGVEMQHDGVHFTPAGADVVARWLAPQIVAASRAEHAPAAPQPAPGGAITPPRWLELLSNVPDTPEARRLTVMNDYARYREAFGVALPGANAGDAELFDYYRALLFTVDGRRSGLAPAPATGMADVPPRLERPGFAIADIDYDVRAGEWQLLGGRLKGGKFAAGDAAEASRSLGEDEALRSLAGALERLGTYTALLSADATSYTSAALAGTIAGPDADAAQLATARVALERETSLLPFEAFAVGAGVDEAGPYTALVLLHGDEAAARENAWRLRARIDEGASWVGGQPFRDVVEDVEINVDGQLVSAKLRMAAHNYWVALPSDTFLFHE